MDCGCDCLKNLEEKLFDKDIELSNLEEEVGKLEDRLQANEYIINKLKEQLHEMWFKEQDSNLREVYYNLWSDVRELAE